MQKRRIVRKTQNVLVKRNQAKKDAGCTEMALHFEYIFYGIYYAEMVEEKYKKIETKRKHLQEFYRAIMSAYRNFNKTIDDGVRFDTDFLLDYFNNHTEIKIQNTVETIPLKNKLQIWGRNNIYVNSAYDNANAFSDAYFFALTMLYAYVMREVLNVSVSKINSILNSFIGYVDSYGRKQPNDKRNYLDDEQMNDFFINEIKWDMRKGVQVDG